MSWAAILAKRDTLCTAFDNFDPAILITYDDAKIESLLKNNRIIRNRQKVNAWLRMELVPASAAISDAISKDLKKRGFKFVGTTTAYAFM